MNRSRGILNLNKRQESSAPAGNTSQPMKIQSSTLGRVICSVPGSLTTGQLGTVFADLVIWEPACAHALFDVLPVFIACMGDDQWTLVVDDRDLLDRF